MSLIQGRFAELKNQGRTALIPYMTAGDPHPDVTVPLMHAMVEAGADIIELGVPFSDPMADGPVIQAASERALIHHTSLHDVLNMVRKFRERDTTTPVILMGYLNPIEVMGYQSFAQAAVEAGVDGALTVDLPPEESEGLLPAMRARSLDSIFLIAPTSTPERISTICANSSGFVYYVSLKGVTGAATLDVGSVERKIKEIRTQTRLPIGVGFGIQDAESAARIGAFADAVVVGSAIVRRIGEHADAPERITEEVTALLREIREALDANKVRAAAPV